MRNAKSEFLNEVKLSRSRVKCAAINHVDLGYEDRHLKVGHSDADFEEFLSLLDFMYDDKYGSQNIYGTIWFEDGTWSTREQYDGSEWWEHHTLPSIPKECL